MCETVCTVNLGPRQGLPDMSVCIKCMVCAEQCPQEAIDIVALYKNKKNNLTSWIGKIIVSISYYRNTTKSYLFFRRI